MVAAWVMAGAIACATATPITHSDASVPIALSPRPAGGEGQGEGGQRPSTSAETALLHADAEMAAARDADAFLSSVDDEAAFGGADGLAVGKAAIRARWAPLFEPEGPRLEWTPERAEVSASGDLGFTTGRWRLTRRPPPRSLRPERPGGPPVEPAEPAPPKTSEGAYATVWVRGADGRWRALFDSSLRPAAGAEGLGRRPSSTRTARAGDLEATAGVLMRSGELAGTYLTVRRRTRTGWETAIDTAVAAPAPP